jgi:hypothetical protein
MNTFNPCIVTCLNGRPRVSELLLLCARRLGIPVVAAYTEKEGGDYMTLSSDPNVVDIVTLEQNRPGEKWNAVLKAAYEHPDNFTHFIIMGDDDVLTDNGAMKLYRHSHLDYVGFRRNCYYELSTGRAMIHINRHENKLIGAGRMISRRAIKQVCVREIVEISREGLPGQCMYKGTQYSFPADCAAYLKGYGYARECIGQGFTGLWPNDKKSGLDHASELFLVVNGFAPVALDLDDDEIYLIDFKSDKNIWSYSILEKKCEPYAAHKIIDYLSDDERKLILSFLESEMAE